MTKPILVCDCYLDTPGAANNFVPLLGPYEALVVRPPHAHWQALATDFAAIIISGSSTSIVDPPPWVTPLEQLVRDAAADDIPTLGVCFGHQVIARALHGSMAVQPTAQVELGWIHVTTHTDDPLFAGMTDTFCTFASHREEVTPGILGLHVLASSTACANQAFRVGTRRMWGVQFHAEISSTEARASVQDHAAKHPERQIDVGRTLAGAVDSSVLVRRLIDNFLAEL